MSEKRSVRTRRKHFLCFPVSCVTAEREWQGKETQPRMKTCYVTFLSGRQEEEVKTHVSMCILGTDNETEVRLDREPGERGSCKGAMKGRRGLTVYRESPERGSGGSAL